MPATRPGEIKGKRERKKRRILMSLTGITVGFLVARGFVLAGFWSFSLEAWAGLLGLTVVIHGLLWLVLQLRWDDHLGWDPHFLYLPWSCVIVLFCLFVVVAPEARVLIPFGFFINLMFLVGLAGFWEVLAFSSLMSGGYLAAILVLRARGESLAVGYEALMAVLLLVLSGFAGTVLEQAKKRKDEMRHNAAELRKLSRAVEQSPGLVIITDTDGKIEYVNPKFTAATGYSAEEAIGKTPALVKSSATPAEVHQELWSQITSGEQWHGEFKNRKKNGEFFWVLASISPIRDREGTITHFLGVQEDITEQKRVEARLIQAQKMEGVGQLVSGVAHDFNNLLTGVLGFTELALAKVDSEGPVYEDLLEVQKAGKSASALTRQLLAFSRQQMLRPVVLDLNRVLNEVNQLLRQTVSERVEIRTVLDPDLGRTRADPYQVQQILINLAVNARDAMPDGGRLVVETANADLDDRYGEELVSVKPGRYVMLKVSDTGRGMDEETQKRVFEPFFTTKERGRGTGLGLATVYGIVKQSRGYIWVSSRPGKGSSFEIYLPRLDGHEEAIAPPESAPAAVLAEGQETVLLVEDDDLVRGLASRALQSQGYRVLQAENPAKAMSLSNENTLDLLITDIVMPETNGVELAERVTTAQPDVKVLLISGYAEQGIVENKLANPETPFLGKPFRIEELLSTVRGLLDQPGRSSRAAQS